MQNSKKSLHRIQQLIQMVTSAYVLIMLLVYPLYYQDKYYNMGEAKYFFFKNVSLICLSVLLFLSVAAFLQYTFLEKQPLQWSKWIRNLSILDWAVIAYTGAVWISFLFSDYKADAIWGYNGWYMGIVSQMIFVLLYFYTSRYIRFRKWMLHAFSIVSAVVMLLAVLHRFQIDPLQMYEGLSMENKVLFLTTMGQATWYSSYLCIVFPIGLYLYWNSEKLAERILYGTYVALGFASMVTQNSDSAFVAFSLMLLVLFVASFRTNRKMLRFLESLLIGLASMRVVGILQLTFPEAVVPLEPLSITASQGKFTAILFWLVLACYCIFYILYRKNKIQIPRYRRIGTIITGAVIFGIFAMVLCIWLNARGILPRFLSPLKQIAYFTFNDDWGNGRGFTWRCSAEIFHEYSLKNKLFGCGPDCFASYAYDRYADTLSTRWGSLVLTNAHNEWFTSLLFFGITGLITYLGIFATAAITFGKQTLRKPFLLAIVMSIVAYFGHNFFCYQQVICTPVIFILMGCGEQIRRNQ